MIDKNATQGKPEPPIFGAVPRDKRKYQPPQPPPTGRKTGLFARMKELRQSDRQPEGYDSGQTTSTLSAHQSTDTTIEAWPDPKEIKTGLLPVPAMDADLLPEAIKAYVTDTANRLQNTPIEGVAIGTLIALGSTIGAGCTMRPKRRDDWQVTCNFWGALIGRPGVIIKSPSLKEPMKPLYELEDEAEAVYSRQEREYDAEFTLFKAQQDALKTKMKSESSSKQNNLKEQYAALEEPPKSRCRRYVLNDATIQKANELLSQNPRGLLHFRDELTGWLASLDREDRAGDRAFFLESYDGDGRKTDDRIGRGTTKNKNLCLSMCGGIQPDKLERYLYESMMRLDNDGLLQRFQLSVYPDARKLKNVDKTPNKEARKRAYALYRKLAHMNFLEHGAHKDDDFERPYFKFEGHDLPEGHATLTAQKFFDNWISAHIDKQWQESLPIMQEHLAKTPAVMAKLALAFHLIDIADGLAQLESKQQALEEGKKKGNLPIELAPLQNAVDAIEQARVKGPVSLFSAKRAAAWCDFLEAHAKRIYGLVANPLDKAVSTLADKIKKGEIEDGFTSRELRRKQWRFLTDPDLAKTACDELVDARWLHAGETEPDWQQKRTIRYFINPKAKKHGKVS